MKKAIFEISKMDCPSEENLIKMKLDEFTNIKYLEFEIQKRKLIVFYEEELDKIEQAVKNLNLGGSVLSIEEVEDVEFKENVNQKKILITILAINFIFFIIEMITGYVSKSMGLVADSLDMLADSFVYGISLLAIGGTVLMKKKIAKIAGYFQIALALVGLIEVVRRFVDVNNVPDFNIMISVSFLALLANGSCLYILQKSKSNDAHMQASMIFTSNDIIINFGVIIAGVMVNWLNSSLPDLIIGMIVFILVIQGAVRILKIGK